MKIFNEFLTEVYTNNISKTASWDKSLSNMKQLWDYSAKKIGQLGEFEVRLAKTPYAGGHGQVYIFVAYRGKKAGEKDEIVCFAHFRRYKDKFWQERHTLISPKYQGQGLGYRLYMFLIKSLNWTLVSDDSHSFGAAKLWQKLVKTAGIKSWVDHPRTGRIRKSKTKDVLDQKKVKRAVMVVQRGI